MVVVAVTGQGDTEQASMRSRPVRLGMQWCLCAGVVKVMRDWQDVEGAVL